MVTDRDKLVRLADAAATRKGLELVVREWHGEHGPMMRLSFQDPGSFAETVAPVLVNFWRSTAAEAYERVEAALADLPDDVPA